MPDYSSLGPQITALKNDITTTLAGSGPFTSTDYAYYANALNTLGTMLGVNDIVAATNTQLTSISTAGTTQVGLVNTAGTTQVAAVNSAGTTQVAAVAATAANLYTFGYMGVLA
jgi:hypothetical protein